MKTYKIGENYTKKIEKICGLLIKSVISLLLCNLDQ